MDMREIVLKSLAATVEKYSPIPFPSEVSDEARLDDFWLDSVIFMELLTKIEDQVGYIPQEILDGSLFPATIGELVAMYQSTGVSA